MHSRNVALLLAVPLTLAAADFRLGVCTHFSQSKGHLPANLAMIRQAGVTTIRDELAWRTIERDKGKYALPEAWREYIDRARDTGLDPLIILDYGNSHYDKGDKPLSEDAIEGFARYSEFIVRSLKGKVRLYEIWNEWDIGIGGTTPGSAESYAKLLAKVYPRIKGADSSITVLGGAMTSGGITRGWLEAMLKAGALKNLDEVSIHTYNYSGSGSERTPEAWAGSVAKVQELVRRYSGGRDVPLNITEMGWPTQIDRRGTPPEISAAYLARMFLLGRSMPYVRGIWWYDFQDDGWTHSYNEHNFGLVRPDLTPKPSFFALKDLAAMMANATYDGSIEPFDPAIRILKFRLPEGRRVWALWSTHPDDDWQITLKAGADATTPVTLTLPGYGSVQRSWGSRNWADGRDARTAPDQLDVTVRETPWLITGNLEGATVTGIQRRERPETARGAVVLR